MLVTDQVIEKFWGNGNGFVFKSIKRWGGFISEEAILENAYHASLVAAIRLRDKGKEFTDELHMINYLMRVCYWSWCDAVTKWKEGDGANVISESKLIPKDADPDFKPAILEPYDMPIEPNILTEKAVQLVQYKFGNLAKLVFEQCILEHRTAVDVSKDLEISVQVVSAKLRASTNYLKRNLRKELV